MRAQKNVRILPGFQGSGERARHHCKFDAFLTPNSISLILRNLNLHAKIKLFQDRPMESLDSFGFFRQALLQDSIFKREAL